MYSKLSVRDAWGRPKRFRSASEAGLVWKAPGDGLVFYAPLNAAATVAETGQALTPNGTISYQTVDNISCAGFGGSSKIQFGNAGIPTGANSFSVSYWKKIPAAGAEAFDFMWGQTDAYNICFGARRLVSGNQSASTHGPSGLDAFNVALDVGHWMHMFWERSGNIYRLYIDNVLKQTVTYSQTIAGNPTCYLGAYVNGDIPFVGYMAGFRIYNVALSEANRTALFKEFKI